MLFYSSLLFSTNTISTFYKKYYIYSFFFLALTMTSLLVHTHIHTHNNNQYITYDKALLIDKVAIAAVIAMGGYIFYKKCINISRFSFIFEKIIIIATFLFVIYLYCYGWCSILRRPTMWDYAKSRFNI